MPPKKRKSSEEGESSHPRKKYQVSFNKDWTREFSGVIKDSSVSPHHARCILCSLDFGISHSGRRDILSHLKTEKHCTKAQLHTVKARPITQHFPSSEESTTGPVIQAEVRFCQFVAENNLSFRVAIFSVFAFLLGWVVCYY